MEDLDLNQLLQIIKKRRIEGNVGDIDYRIGHKDVRGEMNVNDATIRAMLGYDGDFNLNASTPLWGGTLNAEASGSDAGKRYQLGYQRPINGGDINFDASQDEDGRRRIYARLKKTF